MGELNRLSDIYSFSWPHFGNHLTCACPVGSGEFVKLQHRIVTDRVAILAAVASD